MRREQLELSIDELAAGGDGVGRDASGRITFVPRTAPGDRVRVAVTKAASSYARADLVEVIAPGPARRAPACPAFAAGCGGCQWLHVDEHAQREAKQTHVARALRRVPGIAIRPILAPAPALGWRRRARLHVRRGQLGLFSHRSHDLVPLAACPQLDPRLGALLPALVASAPPDGEVAVAVADDGAIALAHQAASWPGASALVGVAGVVGVATATACVGEEVLELEAGLFCRADDFAQASAHANRAIIAAVGEALPPAAGRPLLELYAGAGNVTRSLVAAGWRVTACDVVAPPRSMLGVERIVADAGAALAALRARGSSFAAVVLDPPRAGARDILDALAAIAAERLVYVSCDPATLGRDLEHLARLGYSAGWAQPIDAMPQTAHVETVVALTREVGTTPIAVR